MKKIFEYKINLNGLNVIKSNRDQDNRFFYKGHTDFLIPDFMKEKCDIWLSFLDYLEKDRGEIYDQDGGEISKHDILNKETGLTYCRYTANGIIFDEGDDPVDINVDIEGYVIQDFLDTYFLAQKVTIL